DDPDPASARPARLPRRRARDDPLADRPTPGGADVALARGARLGRPLRRRRPPLPRTPRRTDRGRPVRLRRLPLVLLDRSQTVCYRRGPDPRRAPVGGPARAGLGRAAPFGGPRDLRRGRALVLLPDRLRARGGRVVVDRGSGAPPTLGGGLGDLGDG